MDTAIFLNQKRANVCEHMTKIAKVLVRRERNDTYLTHVWRLLQSIESLEKIEKQLLSANTVIFIS